MKFLMLHGCWFAKLHISRRKCKRFLFRMNIIIIFALFFIPYCIECRHEKVVWNFLFLGDCGLGADGFACTVLV